MISELQIFENNCGNTDALFSDVFFTIKDCCDIGNGLVSGLDKAFQIDVKNLNEEEKIFNKVSKQKV